MFAIYFVKAYTHIIKKMIKMAIVWKKKKKFRDRRLESILAWKTVFFFVYRGKDMFCWIHVLLTLVEFYIYFERLFTFIYRSNCTIPMLCYKMPRNSFYMITNRSWIKLLSKLLTNGCYPQKQHSVIIFNAHSVAMNWIFWIFLNFIFCCF